MSKASVLPTSPKQMRHPVLPKAWDDVGDFWNDPRRWDDVDPFKECFWSVRRPDVIDVRAPVVHPFHPLVANAEGEVLGLNYVSADEASIAWQARADYDDLIATRPGSIIHYWPPLNF